MSDLRNDAGTNAGRRGQCPQRRAAGYDATLLDRAGPHVADPPFGDGRRFVSLGFQCRFTRPLKLASTGVGNTRGPVGWLALFCPGLGITSIARAEHVYADCDGHRCCMGLQHHSDLHSWPVPGCIPIAGRYGCCVFRAGSRHCRPGVARTGAGAARAGKDFWSHQGLAQSHAQDCAADSD